MEAWESESYIGNSDDGEYYGEAAQDMLNKMLGGELFHDKVNKIMCSDDPQRFNDFLRVFYVCDHNHYPTVLDICFERRYVNCALHVIQGNLPQGHPNLSFDHYKPPPFIPVFYHVIHLMCEPPVFHHLLYDCQAATQVNKRFLQLLPLHWLLDLFGQLPPFSHWSPGQSLSTIIDSLFLPEIRPKLECAHMLAQHTRSLDQIAFGYIHNGEIISLAALLLVAPLTKGDFETFKSFTSSIASQVIHDQSVKPSTLCAAAALLSIFEKHGDKLTSMFNNGHKAARVMVEVSTEMQHSGIQVCSMDVDLTDTYCYSSRLKMLKSTCERLGIKIDDTKQISRKSPFPSVKIVKEQLLPKVLEFAYV